MTPHSVHYGLAAGMRVSAKTPSMRRSRPTRSGFKNRRPVLSAVPTAAWTNPPSEEKSPASDPVDRTLDRSPSVTQSHEHVPPPPAFRAVPKTERRCVRLEVGWIEHVDGRVPAISDVRRPRACVRAVTRSR
jgi:hypothetical protein